MNPFPWQCHCAAAEGRPLRPSYQAVGDGVEETKEANAADRLVFTRIRAGATDPVFIIGFVVENGAPRIAAIQGMIQPACFIGLGWSWHPRKIRPNIAGKITKPVLVDGGDGNDHEEL